MVEREQEEEQEEEQAEEQEEEEEQERKQEQEQLRQLQTHWQTTQIGVTHRLPSRSCMNTSPCYVAVHATRSRPIQEAGLEEQESRLPSRSSEIS